MQIGFGFGLGLVRRAGAAAAPALPSGAVGVWRMSDFTTSPRPLVPNQAIATAVTQSLAGPSRRNFALSTFWTNNSLATITDNGATGPDGLTEATIIGRAAGGNWTLSPKCAFNNGATDIPNGTVTVACSVRWRGTGSANFKLGNSGQTYTVQTATATWTRFAVQTLVAGGVAYIAIGSPDGTSAADFEICDFEVFAGSSDLGTGAVASHLYFQKGAGGNAAPVLSAGLLDLTATTNTGYIQFPASQTMGPLSLLWTAKTTGNGTNSIIQAVLSIMASSNSTNFAIGDTIQTTRQALIGGSAVAAAGGGSIVDQYMIDSPNRNVSTGCVTFDGATVKVYSGGQLLASSSSSATGFAVKDFFFNQWGTFWSAKKYGAVALYVRALSAAEVVTATTVLEASTVTGGAAIEPYRYTFFEGDSFTAGSGSTASINRFSSIAEATANPIIRSGNLGVGGSTMATMTARAAACDAYLPVAKNGRKYTLHILLGANDLGGANFYSGNASGFAAAMQSYISARRAAGWDYIIVGTVVSGTFQPDGGTQYDIDRAAYNTTVRGWVGTVINACADFAAVANIGGNGDANNATYFAAKIHPTDAGYALMGPVAAAAINSVWSY